MKKYLCYIYGVIGVMALWLFIDHIAGFVYPIWFYNANPDIKVYCGINVVSRWADLSFFTYHTVILFGLWCILIMIAEALRLKKLKAFLLKDYCISIIITNYIITTTLYTIFELCGDATFGYYGNNWHSIHSIGTNLVAHYVFFIFAILLIFLVKPYKTTTKHTHIIISIYLMLYVIIVKLTGMYCYIIEWYPYAIFNTNIFVVIFMGVALCALYLLIYETLKKYVLKSR